MRCIDEGRLRAYLDGELSATEREAIDSHLGGCAACEGQVATLRATVAAVSATLAARLPESALEAAGERQQAARALAVFQSRLRAAEPPRTTTIGEPRNQTRTKERGPTMIDRLAHFLTPRRRPAFAAVTLLALFGLLLALSPVQSLAESIFQQFRVQQFAAVTVRVPTMTAMPQPRDLTNAEKTQLMQLVSALGTLDTNATPASVREVATQAEAEAFYAGHGGKLRTPRDVPAAFAGQTPRYGVGDPTSSRYTLNVAVARQYLAMLNNPDLNTLPIPNVDQLTFGLDVPAAVVIAYGDKDQGFGVVQLASPTLTVPDEVDVEAFRAAVLALPGLPEDTVNQVKAIKDWQKTLIIPVPEDAVTSNVEIRTGAFVKVPGLLIVDGQGRGSLLLWEAEGVLYAVGGHLTGAEAQAVAESMMR